MFNMSNLVIKDKAWRRVGESPITTNSFLSFVVSQHRQVFLKKYMSCETTNDKQHSGDPKCVA